MIKIIHMDIHFNEQKAYICIMNGYHTIEARDFLLQKSNTLKQVF